MSCDQVNDKNNNSNVRAANTRSNWQHVNTQYTSSQKKAWMNVCGKEDAA